MILISLIKKEKKKKDLCESDFIKIYNTLHFAWIWNSLKMTSKLQLATAGTLSLPVSFFLVLFFDLRKEKWLVCKMISTRQQPWHFSRWQENLET